MVVVGVAAVLGLAVVAASSLQVQQSHNEQLAAEAEALAESGVNLAMFYLQYPPRAPALKNGYWPGGQNLSLGADVRGTMDVYVTRDDVDPQVYRVASTGKATTSAEDEIKRTVKASLRVRPGLQVRHALIGGGNLSVGPLVKMPAGNILVDGGLTNLAVLSNATAWARSFPVLGTLLRWFVLAPEARVEMPRPRTIEKYEMYAWGDGRSYVRQRLSGGLSGTVGPNPQNPLGVYWATGPFALNSGATVNGTLIVEGNLVVNGGNVRITAPPGMPALIVTGDVRTTSNRSMTVNGITWVGGVVKGDGLLPSLLTTMSFNGSLMFGETGAIDLSAGTLVEVRFDPTRVNVPDMDKELARGVTVMSWDR